MRPRHDPVPDGRALRLLGRGMSRPSRIGRTPTDGTNPPRSTLVDRPADGVRKGRRSHKGTYLAAHTPSCADAAASPKRSGRSATTSWSPPTRSSATRSHSASSAPTGNAGATRSSIALADCNANSKRSATKSTSNNSSRQNKPPDTTDNRNPSAVGGPADSIAPAQTRSSTPGTHRSATTRKEQCRADARKRPRHLGSQRYPDPSRGGCRACAMSRRWRDPDLKPALAATQETLIDLWSAGWRWRSTASRVSMPTTGWCSGTPARWLDMSRACCVTACSPCRSPLAALLASRGSLAAARWRCRWRVSRSSWGCS
jgi:hypothetical protein